MLIQYNTIMDKEEEYTEEKKKEHTDHFEKNHEKYEKYYDEGKFEKLVKKLPRKVSEPFVRLYFVMKHPDIDSTSKIFCIAALGYVVFPFDLIPDAIPFVGWLDDLAVVGYTLKKLHDWTHSDWVNEKVKEFYKDKDTKLSPLE